MIIRYHGQTIDFDLVLEANDQVETIQTENKLEWEQKQQPHLFAIYSRHLTYWKYPEILYHVSILVKLLLFNGIFFVFVHFNIDWRLIAHLTFRRLNIVSFSDPRFLDKRSSM